MQRKRPNPVTVTKIESNVSISNYQKRTQSEKKSAD